MFRRYESALIVTGVLAVVAAVAVTGKLPPDRREWLTYAMVFVIGLTLLWWRTHPA